jgi:peptidoglycan/xylan/chitin deacetylase (PgdA/CDA1 family)
MELQKSLENTKNAIYKSCNLDPELILDVRPPNGLFLPRTLDLLTSWGYRPVMWSVVPEDWVHPGVDIVTQRVIKQTQNGSIIVLHDGDYGGKDVAKTADKIIAKLLEQGYQFVTISKFWQSAKQ